MRRGTRNLGVQFFNFATGSLAGSVLPERMSNSRLSVDLYCSTFRQTQLNCPYTTLVAFIHSRTIVNYKCFTGLPQSMAHAEDYLRMGASQSERAMNKSTINYARNDFTHALISRLNAFVVRSLRLRTQCCNVAKIQYIEIIMHDHD